MDLSTYWAFLQRHKSKTSQLLLLLIFFAGGWQLGKVTSPYYAAHPIVFEDNACDRVGGTTEELSALKEQGVAQREPVKEEQVAENKGVSSQPSPAAVAGTQIGTTKKFVGSINSDLFHDPSCGSSKRIKESNQIWFFSIEDAQKAGYSPSKCTQEKLGI